MTKYHYPSNEGRLYFFNFTIWRKMRVKAFFYAKNNAMFVCSSFEDARKKGLDGHGKILIYGVARYPELEAFAHEHALPIYRIEDAFIRSVTLGSTFAKPYSLIVDSRGIHFDPERPSDIEVILQEGGMDDALLQRARALRQTIVESRLSKYNHLDHKAIVIKRRDHDKVLLVVGQVEDDMSVRLGGHGMTNQKLLETVRRNNPNAYIIYKPHPDVLSGNRNGHIPVEIMHQLADDVQTEVSIDACIGVSDEVHTITSGAGLDALLRGKKVVTYGLPFYAGWGLTQDHHACPRRTRTLTINELVAGALILYPRYISPQTGAFCEVEQVLTELKAMQERYFNDPFYRYRMEAIGYVLPRIRKGARHVLRPFRIKI